MRSPRWSASGDILGVAEPLAGRIEITVESMLRMMVCPGCGERAWVEERPIVELADLTCFGRPVNVAVAQAPLRLSEVVVSGRHLDS